MARVFENDRNKVTLHYMENKIKVVWVCHLSNPDIRKNLKFSKWSLVEICKRIVGKGKYYDFASWNTKGIQEFEKFEDIELHIIAPHYGIKGLQEFEMNNIHYHFFHTEDDNILSLFTKFILHKVKKSYSSNTKRILSLIEQIKPDLVHLIGIENPYYAESALSMTKEIPLIATLQTLMIDLNFQKNYPISKESYDYRAGLEETIIKRANYVASKVEHFRSIIRDQIGQEIKFLDISLAVGEKVNLSISKKLYDFVYFAADISKAIDYALEAFAIAKKKYKDITLHVIGGYDETLMNDIKQQMKRLGLEDGVDFTGKLPTYDDVISEVRKCRFALLPLKIDLISGTIREAMANGLPVVTTITPATPKLNVSCECVLLSEKGNFEAMASNMCRLLKNPEFAERMRQNSSIYLQERYDNKSTMNEWRKAYYEILNK